MKQSEILKAAKEIISNPNRWTQGAYYRDAAGNPVLYMNDAQCFCSLGAIRKARGVEADFSTEMRYLENVIYATTGRDIHDFNDSTTHKNVLAAFDKAIDLAEAEGD